MRKLSEYKNEEAIELLADILDPVSVILTDEDVKNTYRTTKNKMAIIKIILKNHPSEVVDILALLEGVPRNEYECNVVSAPVKLIELSKDKELMDFFKSQGQNLDVEFSGSATENIEETEEI